MAMTIRDLLVKVGVNADTPALLGFDRALKGVRSTMRAAATGAVVLTGAVVAATASAFALAKATADEADAISEAANRTGVAIDKYQELGHGLQMTGSSVEALEALLRKQQLSMSEAATGTGGAADAYRRLGVAVKDQHGQFRDQYAVLLDVADGIAATRDRTAQLALATDVFGKSGADILPLLREGSAGIRRYGRDARALGLVITETEAAMAGKFNDTLDEARGIVRGLTRQVGLALIPTFTRMLTGFRDWFILNRDIVRQRLDQAVRAIGDGFTWVGARVRDVDTIVRKNLGGWTNLIVALTVAVAGFGALLGSTKLLGSVAALASAGSTALGFFSTLAGLLGLPVWATAVVFIAGVALQLATLIAPLAAGAAGFAALVLIVDEILTTLRGGDSVWRRFLDWLGIGEQTIASFNDAATETRSLMLELWGLASDVAAILRSELEPAIVAIGTALDTYVVQPITRTLAMLERLARATLRPLAGIPALQAEAVAGAASAGRGRIAGARAALAPRVAEAAASRSTSATYNFSGDTINGVGMSAREVEALQERRDQRRRRMMLDATAGGEL